MLTYHKEEIGKYFWDPSIGERTNKLYMFLVEKLWHYQKVKTEAGVHVQ